MNDLLEVKQPVVERERSKSETYQALKANISQLSHLLSTFDPKYIRLVRLFEYFNSAENIRYHNVDFTKIIVKSKKVLDSGHDEKAENS